MNHTVIKFYVTHTQNKVTCIKAMLMETCAIFAEIISEGLDGGGGGGLVFTVHLKFCPLFISLKFLVIH